MSGYCFDCGHTICVCADDIPARDPITRACDPLGSDATKVSDARTLDSGGQRMVGTSPPDSRAGISATEELTRLRSLLQTTEAARPLPDRSSRPQDTYHWGETMAQYAALGIGVDAWVELQRIERDGIRRQNNDLSGMLISWRTFVLVMKVLRAIRIEDFKELETLRTRIVAAESRLSSLTLERDELLAALKGLFVVADSSPGAISTVDAVIAAKNAIANAEGRS